MFKVNLLPFRVECSYAGSDDTTPVATLSVEGFEAKTLHQVFENDRHLKK